MRRTIFLMMLSCIVQIQLVHGQDAHFSQFYEAPLLLNPARAGFINGTYQLSGIYRSQWKNITLPFKTLSGTINLNVPSGKNKNNIVGIAIIDFVDKAGDATYTTNHVDAVLAFHKNFGANFNQYIGGGLMLGFASTTFDLSKLTFDEDFMSGTNTETIANSKASYFDLSFGAEYNYLKEDQHFNAGIAIYHLTQPSVSYSNNSSSVIYRKFVVNVGYATNLSKLFDVIPRAAFFFQGPSREIDFGADVKFHLIQNATTNYAIYAGGYYRVGDALIPKLRIDMGDLSFSFSYDFTVSKLGQVSQAAGGPEITLLYLGRVKGVSAGRIYNPRF